MYIVQLGVAIASLFSEKLKKMRDGERDAFRVLSEKVDPEARYIWVHAASLGEFEQGRPIIEYIREHHPEYKILLTFFSPSGYEVRKNYEGADIICYLPIDTVSNARRFLKDIHVEMAFFIKYEFWQNFMLGCHHHKIPFYSVSSIFRPNKVYFRWDGRLYAQVLKTVSHFFVQDKESAQLLERLSITKNVTIVGDTRFDRVIDICSAAKELPLIERFKDGHTVIVAGSSWGPDEDLLIPYFNEHPEVKLILAPHVIDESHLKQIESKLARPFRRYTDAEQKVKVLAQKYIK